LRELREGFKNLERKDGAGVVEFLRHFRYVEELERRVAVDVAFQSTRPYLIFEYVDFSNVGLEHPALSLQVGEFIAGAERGYHDMDTAHDLMERLLDFFESHVNVFRQLRREIAAKYAGLMAGPPPRAREPRLSVNVAEETVKLNDEVHHLDAGKSAVIKILADAKGLWVTREKMKEISDLVRPRPDRIIWRLPKAILSYIESGNSGYRLKWEELE
jgi:hypothetical protein